MKFRSILSVTLGLAWTATACSSTSGGGGGGLYYADIKGGDGQFSADGLVVPGDGISGADGSGADATTGSDAPNSATDAIAAGNDGDTTGGGTDASGGQDTTVVTDTGVKDTGSTIADTGPDAVDFDSFFDPDTGPDAVFVQDVTIGGGLSFVFAHSSDTLYRMDKAGFVKIGYFSFDKNPGSMTDIAMDKLGTLYGVTFDDLFKCDSKTAKCVWLAALPESFNGLTFVPKGTVKPNDEALIGIANSGTWNLIEVTGTTAKVTSLGSYGGYTSSGDAFSVESIGTFATVKDSSGFSGTDFLVEVDPTNGKVLKNIGDTGVSDLWGFAWFGGKFYGFSDDTNVYEVNTTTGKATISTAFAAPTGVQWWGAAVSTRAAMD